MYFFQIPFDMITVSFGSIAVGAGIDDAIHFLIRYKNKLGIDNRSVEMLLSETLRETGRPIILTTISIVGGMIMFLFASYTPVRYFGSLMSMALVNCMLSTLFIMPSLIRLVTNLQRKFGLRRQQSELSEKAQRSRLKRSLSVLARSPMCLMSAGLDMRELRMVTKPLSS